MWKSLQSKKMRHKWQCFKFHFVNPQRYIISLVTALFWLVNGERFYSTNINIITKGKYILEIHHVGKNLSWGKNFKMYIPHYLWIHHGGPPPYEPLPHLELHWTLLQKKKKKITVVSFSFLEFLLKIPFSRSLKYFFLF